MGTLRSSPLERFQCVHTRDVDEAREQIGRIFCPHRLTPGAGPFLARHHTARQAGWSVNYVSYGAEVEIDPGELAQFFLLQVPLRGGAQVRCGSRLAEVEAGRRASLLSPTLPSRMLWRAGCEKLIVLISRQQVEAVFAAMSPGAAGPLEFDTDIDLTTPTGQAVARHAALSLEAAEQADALPGAYRAMLRDGLICLLLSGLAHNRSKRLARSDSEGGPRAVRRAMHYLDAHYARPFSAVDVAQAAGVSLRALQDAMRKARGETLWQAAQNVRLEKLRGLLLAAEEPTTVAGAAYACGLGHPGRAAAAYHSRYGETPSQTLKRAAR